MIEDKALSGPLEERYAGWKSAEGKAMLSGKRTLEEIAARVVEEGHRAAAEIGPAGIAGECGQPVCVSVAIDRHASALRHETRPLRSEHPMKQTWRWFGPIDKVTLADARQAGVEGIVTALHHVATGAVWTPEEIEKRQREVAFHPDGSMTHLAWDVVESLPVSEAIKTQTGEWRAHIVHYRRSLENLARAGIRTVCYNFMPVLDWTRTELAWPLPNGGRAMRFDLADFAAFDIHVLKRKGAAETYSGQVVAEAARRVGADGRRAARKGSPRTSSPGCRARRSTGRSTRSRRICRPMTA